MTNQPPYDQERELRAQGKDPATLRAHGIESVPGMTMRRLPGLPSTPHFDEACKILFGGVLMEHKDDRCERCYGHGTERDSDPYLSAESQGDRSEEHTSELQSLRHLV